jgi:hypothetical protein
MSDRLSEFEAKLGEMGESLRVLERRIGALEQRRAVATAPAAARGPARPSAADATGADVSRELAALTGNLTLAGRTLLVLAGGFLLRAITDSGAIPAWLGVALGCAYAGVWVALAYRIGAAQPWSAAFHGVAAILIGFPLLVESTLRFRLLSPAAAVVFLTGFTGVALAVAARRRLHLFAWLVEIGGIFTALALMIATGLLAPPVLYLALLGVAALWLGYVLDWVYLRWPVAFVADLSLVFLTLRAVGATSAEGPRTALLVQVVVLALYLGSIATRTLLLSRAVVDFEVVQTAVLIAVGLGGASYLSVNSGLGQAAVGVVAIVFGAATYATAFAFLERRQRSKANFYFYGTIALVFVLAGTGLLLQETALSITWAALAVLACLLARRLQRYTLAVHGCVYAAAGAYQGGALSHAATAVVSSVAVPWPPASPALPVIVIALFAAAWSTGAPGAAPLQPAQRVPRCATIGILAIATSGLLLGCIVPLFAGSPGPGANVGVAATVRTAVLVAGTLLLAWVGKRESWREAGWLAYPVLVVAGFKLVLEDIARSPPASLFVAFALYGTALILVPRLRRREARRAPAPTSVNSAA